MLMADFAPLTIHLTSDRPEALITPRWNWVTYASVLLSAVIGVAMLTSIVPAMRVFPNADELAFVEPLTSGSLARIAEFIVGAHGDHRLPIQKLVQSIILLWSGFDYSALIAANIPLAVAFSIVLTLLSLEYRKFSSVGDMLIPLATMPFTASFLFVGFNVIFMAALFFVALASYCLLRYQRERWAPLEYVGLSCLVICATFGLPGAVIAMVVAIIIAGSDMVLSSERNKPAFYYFLAATIAVSLLQAVLWSVGWHPDTASQPLPVLLALFYNSLGSSLQNFARPGYEWKGAVIIAMLVGSIATLAWYAARRTLSFRDALVAAPLFASLCIIFVIAKGRGFEPWAFRYDSHYGYLTVLIPVLSWIIVSARLPKMIVNILGVGLVAFYAMAFEYNMRARVMFLDYEGPTYRAIQREIASSKPSIDIAKEQRNMRYEDNPPAAFINGVAHQIDLLRQHGSWRYREPPVTAQ